MKPDIHILSYNNLPYTIATLKMLRRTAKEHRLWVWDNGSSTENYRRLLQNLTKLGLGCFVARLEPDEKWTREKKIGVAKNKQIVEKQTTDWIVQLDNDTWLREGWWEEMEKYIAAFPNIRLWPLFMAPNHKTLRTVEKDGLTIRKPSMISGAAVLFDRTVAIWHKVLWPEGRVNYRDHPYWSDMGGFQGIDVEFGDKWVRKGLGVALPKKDLAVHMWQDRGRYD